MSYEERFELVKRALIMSCKDDIQRNWGGMFDMWLSCEADMCLGENYLNNFKEQFSDYMNQEIKTLIWFAGKNIVFALSSFISYNKNINLEDVLRFTENFILYQLNDFTNWCDDISIKMYEESSDYKKM